MEPRPPAPPYAVSVLVLTGGRSRRMGSHKPSLEVGGSPMVERVLAAVRPRPVLVVGRADDVPDGIPVLVEDPPGGGPVAAVAAGVRGLAQQPERAQVVVLLAADLPFVTSSHLDRLVAAAATSPDGSGLAVTRDRDGRLNWLCSAWRADVLTVALDLLGDPEGRSMRALAGGRVGIEVDDLEGVAGDVDTPEDLARARSSAGDA